MKKEKTKQSRTFGNKKVTELDLDSVKHGVMLGLFECAKSGLEKMLLDIIRPKLGGKYNHELDDIFEKHCNNFFIELFDAVFEVSENIVAEYTKGNDES